MQKQLDMREKRRMEELQPMDQDLEFNVDADLELQSRLKATQDRIRNKSRTQIYDMLAKFDKKLFTMKTQEEDQKQSDQKSEINDDQDLAYKLHLKAVMQ